MRHVADYSPLPSTTAVSMRLVQVNNLPRRKSSSPWKQRESMRNKKESAPPSVIYTFSFAHHGSYSSFHRLAHYLADQCVVDITSRSIDRLPSRISTRLADRWLKYSEYRLRRYLRSGIPRCVHYIY